MAGNQNSLGNKESNGIENGKKTSGGVFCLDDYDCIGFDMDHTVVQYHLPEFFKLTYQSFARYLVEKKGYDNRLLTVDIKDEDYSFRGLTFEMKSGNFLKLDENGYILRACHGMRPLTDEEIVKEYGKERIWESFPQLKERVHHGATFKSFENFFDMPIGVLCARIVEIIDETQDKPASYDFWPDIVEIWVNSFGPTAFKEQASAEKKGYFFPYLTADADRYVKKCPQNVKNWLKKLRDSGKMIFLLTQSHVAYTKFLMEFSLGEDWMDCFDFVITYANKPDFFKVKPDEQPFRSTEEGKEDLRIENLVTKTCYSHGNAITLESTAKKILEKENVKVVYFGDSPKSDVFPPNNFCNWDTVAILEEMEAEGVHFHEELNSSLNGVPQKKQRRVHEVLKEEKMIVTSKQWGSFFRDDREQEDSKNSAEGRVNTFWGSVIRDSSRIAIPLLDYLTDLPISFKFESFSDTKLGFFPSPPSTVLNNIE